MDLSVKAQKFLDKLNKLISERIIKRLKRLGENQVPSDAKFIKRDQEDMIFRYRIGEFRALYKVKHKEKIVLIVKIDKRPQVYKS